MTDPMDRLKIGEYCLDHLRRFCNDNYMADMQISMNKSSLMQRTDRVGKRCTQGPFLRDSLAWFMLKSSRKNSL
jgi:hypothetical protein